MKQLEYLTPDVLADQEPAATNSDQFQQGYNQARRDLLGELVFHAEQFLHDRCTNSTWNRKFLYGFIDRLEQRLDSSAERHLVAGGLGI